MLEVPDYKNGRNLKSYTRAECRRDQIELAYDNKMEVQRREVAMQEQLATH